MSDSIHKRISRQIYAIWGRFVQTAGLPFNEILSTGTTHNIVDEEADGY